MVHVDANVILRYLLDDIPEQAKEAHKAIDSGAAANIEVIAEVVYVLRGVYGVPRTEISSALSALCARLSCERADILMAALERYGATSFDFVDCVLIATAEVRGERVLTFDKKLARAISRASSE